MVQDQGRTRPVDGASRPLSTRAMAGSKCAGTCAGGWVAAPMAWSPSLNGLGRGGSARAGAAASQAGRAAAARARERVLNLGRDQPAQPGKRSEVHFGGAELPFDHGDPFEVVADG